MKVWTLVFFILLIALPLSNAAQERAPTIELDGGKQYYDASKFSDLNDEVLNTADDDIYSLMLYFDDAPSIAELDLVAKELTIPSIRTFIVINNSHQQILVPPVGLGELYPSERARQYMHCRALITVHNAFENELRTIPVDDWKVGKIQVYANAASIRELLAGTFLPPATLGEGFKLPSKSLDWWADQIKQQTSRNIELSDGAYFPAPCQSLVVPIESAVLETMPDPAMRTLPRKDNEESIDYSLRVIDTLPSDSLLSIVLKFNINTEVEKLATLVSKYSISGMRSTMTRTSGYTGNKIAEADLSIYGAPLETQVKRARCEMTAGGYEYTKGEWFSDSARVTLPIDNAKQLLNDPVVVEAKINRKFPPSAVNRLKEFHENSAVDKYEHPPSKNMPEDCTQFYE